MATIFTFGTPKGGQGKSTLSLLAANALSNAPFSHKVTVIDFDSQQSISYQRAFDLEELKGDIPYDVKGLNLSTYAKQLKQLDKDNDFLILDLPGRAGNDVMEIIKTVDFLFVPITPSNFAVSSTLNFLRKIKPIREKKNFEVYGLLNRVNENRSNTRNLKSEADEMKLVYNMPFLKTRLRNYVAFENVNTIDSLYNEGATNRHSINFKNWFEEIYNIIA